MESAASDPAANDQPRSMLRFERVAPWLLGLICLLVYVRGLHAPLIFDDIAHIRESAGIRSLVRGDAAFLRESRAFTAFTLAVNYAISGDDTASYHLVNMLIHGLVAATLFCLVHRVLRLQRWRDAVRRDAPYIAFAVALLWAVHPLNSQAVAYIIQRAESLMALWYLLVFYCTLRTAQATGRARIAWGAASVASCALGMASKEVIVTAPLMAVLFDRLFLAGSFRAIGRRYILHALHACTWVMLLFGGIGRTLGIGGATAARAAIDPPQLAPDVISRVNQIVGTVAGTASQGDPTVGFGSGASPVAYLLTQAQVIVHYLRLTVWPDTLVLDYGWPFVDSFGDVWWQFALLAVLFAASVVMLFRVSWVGFAGLFFFVVLGPTSSLVPVADAAFEHRMYLPLTALAVLAVGGGYAVLGEKHRTAAVATVGVLAVALAVRTYVRVGDYLQPSVIWQKAAEACPHNERAWINYGAALYDESAHMPIEQRVAVSMPAYEKALEHSPDSSRALVNLGTSHFLIGEIDKAEAYYLRAVQVKPRTSIAWFRLGIVERHRADANPEHMAEHLAKAEAYFRRAIEAQSGNLGARELLGVVLARQGRYDEAIKELRIVVTVNEKYASAWSNLGRAYQEKGDMQHAEESMRRAIEADPKDPVFANNLGQLLARIGRLPEATPWFDRATQLDPGYVTAWDNLGTAYRLQGMTSLAAGSYEQALAADRNAIRTLDRLAMIYAASPDEAVRKPERAIQMAEHANKLTNFADPNLLETLAAAYASGGRFPDAVATTSRMIEILKAGGAPAEVVARFEARRDLYQRGIPLHQQQKMQSPQPVTQP